MPLLIAILVTATGGGAVLVLVSGFLKGTRWSLRRRLHRKMIESGRSAEGGADHPVA